MFSWLEESLVLTPFGRGLTKPCGGFETLALPSCVRGKIAFVLSSFTSSLCSCVSALLVPVSNEDYPFFLLDIRMYRKICVLVLLRRHAPFDYCGLSRLIVIFA